MADHNVLSDLLVVFAISIAVVFVFHQLRLPSIAGFLSAGALIGPYGLTRVGSESGQVLADLRDLATL